ncbi:hypothetical protein LHGZ1_1564 [Laribacter hongkongensis]|uniref:Uncharacterized protein n=1 Tax=Laribacter hongkongensis TaxID=168471 RepID=A0A248LIN3_9NEIS|nr:hypothetical protein LHGZ1_1564 [Laribacter hongkongensis]
MPQYFLSCLSGSERGVLGFSLDATFLSCLSGSEPAAMAAFALTAFLSCLSGSEPYSPTVPSFRRFLSCLSGSEHGPAAGIDVTGFLSCLSGSEHGPAAGIDVTGFLSCLSGSELQSFCVFPCKNKRVTAYPCNYPFSPHPCKSLNFKDGKHVLEKGSLINPNNHFQPAHPAGFFIPGAPS